MKKMIGEIKNEIRGEMGNHNPSSEEYAHLLEQLNKLADLEGKSFSILNPTFFTSLMNLLSLLLIVNYERFHVLGSKAIMMIGRGITKR